MIFSLGGVLAIAIAYLLGSIPFAKILVQLFAKKDITNEGTGNVGAMNSYDVTGSKIIGIVVALLDITKGTLAVYIATLLSEGNFTSIATAAVFVILAHSYNPWLRWKGGRGLAPTVGVLLLIYPVGVFIWLVMYGTTYITIRKNIHVAAMGGIIGSVILILSAPQKFHEIMLLMEVQKISQLHWMIICIAALLFVRHLQPIRDFIKNERSEEQI
jgi:glycerol-3-phosphate acyltransferase PlsY